MTREYPGRPLPAVLAIVPRDGRVLLVQRGRDPDRGKWGFPGGLIEPGETVPVAALRELAEETGVVAVAGPVVEVIDVVTPDAEGRARYHFRLTAVLCRWVSGDGAAGDDAAALGWFTPGEIAGLPCSRNVERLARAVLSR
ncbi:MAG: NUDIX domain-containing protein [Magnetospirillum sp.]|nr:NUDIX domain-containing protein [Magnetospirillum sp.]